MICRGPGDHQEVTAVVRAAVILAPRAGLRGERFKRLTADIREEFRRMRDVNRFVAANFADGLGREIGCVSLNQQPICRNVLCNHSQCVVLL